MSHRIEPAGYAELPAPYSMDDEQALLGALINADCSEVLAINLSPDHFYFEAHQWYWAAMLQIAQDGGTVDDKMIKASMNGHFEAAGGFTFYAKLMAEAGSFNNLQAHAERIRELALRRRIIDAGLYMARMAGTPSSVNIDIPYQGPPPMTSRELIDASYKALDTLAPVSDRPVVTMASSISSVYDQRLDAMRRRQGDDKRRADMSFGFEPLDAMTDYVMAPGVLAIIQALPKMGKTTLGLQIMLSAAAAGYPVIYATYEMTVARLTRRAWAIHSGVPESAIRDGRTLADDQEQALADSMAALAALPIQYVTTPIEELETEVRITEERYGRKGLLVVDNVNSAARIEGNENQQAQISESLGLLDGIKLHTGFAILGLSHQRDDYDKQASMEKLRALLRPNLFNSFGSRAAMRYGELVMGLWRPEVISQQISGFDDSLGEDGTPNGAGRLFLLATRDGPSAGTCKLKFNETIPRFEIGNWRNVNLEHELDEALRD